MKWIGILETRMEVEADSEEEAIARMAAQLIRDMEEREDGFIVWCTGE